jgi:hypothetical protein
VAQTQGEISVTDTAIQTTAPAPLAAGEMIQIAFHKAMDAGGAEALAVANLIIEQMAKQRDYEDRERFNEALRRIQDELKPIAKKGWNNETKSWYATSDSVDDAIEALIRREGMTLTFRPEPSPHPENVLIIGILSLGAYSREYPLDMPADGKGAKGGGVMTRTHATVSAVTYGTRTLKKMIFNLRYKADDDGNKAGGSKAGPGSLSEKDNLAALEDIRNAGDGAELQRIYLEAQRAADAVGDTKSTIEFANAKRERFIALKKVGKI